MFFYLSVLGAACASLSRARVVAGPVASALSFAVGASVAVPTVAWAQTAVPAIAGPVDSLPEMVVTATRIEQPVTDLVADVSIVDRETIERSGATGVVDVLSRLPGIQIQRNGGVGNTSSVFIRGAETRFTAVYIDGVRVDSQTTGGATWEAIPLAQIERIEVLRGPAAAVYGSDAIGGVIQLFTRRGEGPPRPSVSIGAGTHGLRDAQVGLSGSAGAFDYSLGAAYTESKGFDLRTENVKHNPDRDGYRTHSANARLGYRFSDRQRVEVIALDSITDSNYDDFSYDAKKPVSDRSSYHLSTLGAKWTAQWTDAYKTTLAINESITRYETFPSPYETKTTLRNVLFQNEYRLGASRFTAALERREDRLLNPALDNTSTTLDKRRLQDALALGYSYVVGPHSLQVNARHDRDSEFGGKTTGSIAYGFAFTPEWRATASVGTAFKAPTLYQRFSEFGDAQLTPETGRNAEIGLRYANPAWGTTASLTAYQNRVRDLIVFDGAAKGCESAFGCYSSVGRAQYRGITLAGSQQFGDVSLRAALDWQDPRDLETGKLLPRRAKRYATLGADWRIGTWTLGGELQASSGRFDDAANKRRLQGYGIVNLTASTTIGQDLTLLARVENVGDKNYQLVRDYRTAGRTFYVGLKWQPS